MDGWDNSRRKTTETAWLNWRVVVLIVLITFVLIWRILENFSTGPFVSNAPVSNRLLLTSDADNFIPYLEPAATGTVTGADELIAIRVGAVKKASHLVSNQYQPSEAIFSGIRKNHPWFSLTGFFYYFGEADKLHPGPPAEIRSIANPFMLIVPEFWGLSIWAQGNLIWDNSRITDDILLGKDFPLFPRPDGVTIVPQDRKAVVNYDISKFLKDVNNWTTIPLTAAHADFGVVAYNARDWGFKFIHLDSERSKNVANAQLKPEPTELTEYLAWSETICGYSRGCNHRSDPLPGWDNVKISALPAEAVFKLWYENPGISLSNPDFIYRIRFK